MGTNRHTNFCHTFRKVQKLYLLWIKSFGSDSEEVSFCVWLFPALSAYFVATMPAALMYTPKIVFWSRSLFCCILPTRFLFLSPLWYIYLLAWLPKVSKTRFIQSVCIKASDISVPLCIFYWVCFMKAKAAVRVLALKRDLFYSWQETPKISQMFKTTLWFFKRVCHLCNLLQSMYFCLPVRDGPVGISNP